MTFKIATVPKYLTLEEGAGYLSQAIGETITPRELLALAEDGQFSVFAGLGEKPAFHSVTQIKHPSPSDRSFYMFPLSCQNVQELMAQGHTLISKISGICHLGENAGKEVVLWEIAQGAQPPKVHLTACRISREHLDRWLDVNRHLFEKPESSAVPSRAEQHIKNILTVVAEKGYDRNAIPRGGKKLVKAECLDRFHMSESVFNHYWKNASKNNQLSIEDKGKYKSR